MIAAAHWPRATCEEYLAAERAAKYKSEYIGGYIVAMPGVSRAHTIIMVARNRVLVEHYRRRGDGWHSIAYDTPEQSLYLPSLACTLPLKGIYRKVRFPAEHLPRR